MVPYGALLRNEHQTKERSDTSLVEHLNNRSALCLCSLLGVRWPRLATCAGLRAAACDDGMAVVVLRQSSGLGRHFWGQSIHELFALVHKNLLSQIRRESEEDTGSIHFRHDSLAGAGGCLTIRFFTS